ncbi:hypothetical protein TRVL_02985 [Trypanosoma vivax]|uniref:Uncharacterized protein n=1 Tax=Trypanosoma vivax (strain Y486) TaxID=1055687 RepID=G0TYK7_TRYVY|nr:hypothetical protein TRVL_02985 [Trypanosoma vivax]CCC49054.1 conserved hypothetical protein [Trypanosoma vivax Y486]
MNADVSNAIRIALLKEGMLLAPTYGFKSECLFAAAKRSLSLNSNFVHFNCVNSANFAQLFPRGFPIAVIENILMKSNADSLVHLEQCFSKNAILNNVAKHTEPHKYVDFTLPSVKNVVVEAMDTKICSLVPFAPHWFEATSLECLPSNVPHAARYSIEFIDSVCYYAERVKRLKQIILSGKIVSDSGVSDFVSVSSNSRSLDDSSFIKPGAETVWKSFALVAPLSSAPVRGGILDCEWYALRFKVASVFSLCMLSFLGDKSYNHKHTREMAKSIINTLF